MHFGVVAWMQLLWTYDVQSHGWATAKPSRQAGHSLWASPGGDGSREAVEEAGRQAGARARDRGRQERREAGRRGRPEQEQAVKCGK